MKLPLFFIFGFMNLLALAQTEEDLQVKQNIIEFFDAFHGHLMNFGLTMNSIIAE